MKFRDGFMLLGVLSVPCLGISLDVNDDSSIKSAASTLAYGLMKYYTNNATDTPRDKIGLLPFPPYYWWQSGALWGAMVDYWAYTKDESYVPATIQGLLSQKGPNDDYIVPEHKFDEGNDDQAFWGFALISAVESNFPNPPPPNLTWLTYLQRLFDNQIARWDNVSCSGGMRWQIYPDNANVGGYDYKNAISNGGTFALAARLARLTGNHTYYATWATKIWDWSVAVRLIDAAYNVYDGTDSRKNCTDLNSQQWSYNVAVYLYGASAMYDVTKSDIWLLHTYKLMTAAAIFLHPSSNGTPILYEQACERAMKCNNDQLTFKGYLARWMVKAGMLAPGGRSYARNFVVPSALGAAQSCTGGKDGRTCGTRWYVDGWDGTEGMGQQMSALETVQSLLIANKWQSGL